MASVELLEPAVKPEPSPETLSRKLDEQVGEVVERAEGALAPEQNATNATIVSIQPLLDHALRSGPHAAPVRT